MKRALALLAAATMVVALIAVRAAFYASDQFRSEPHPVPIPMDAPVGLRRVEPGGLAGWLVPSRNGAAIVLCHGSGADRMHVWPEARALAAAGYGVLLFDWPGHGESKGTIRWSEPERAALRTAIDALAAEPSVRRLGALGFSLGGYVLAQVAPSDPRLRALVFEATPPDARTQTRTEFGRWGPLSAWPALIAWRLHGMEVDAAQPVDAMRRLGDRELLFVAGERDAVVPVSSMRALWAAAGARPGQLRVVPGARHTDLAASSEPWLGQLVAFFDGALGR